MAAVDHRVIRPGTALGGGQRGPRNIYPPPARPLRIEQSHGLYQPALILTHEDCHFLFAGKEQPKPRCGSSR